MSNGGADTEIGERLKRMVENDGGGEIKKVMRVVESDVMALLCEFMDVARLDTRVQKNGDGYMLTVEASVDKFYGVGNLSVLE